MGDAAATRRDDGVRSGPQVKARRGRPVRGASGAPVGPEASGAVPAWLTKSTDNLPLVLTLAEVRKRLRIGRDRALADLAAGTFPLVPLPHSPRRSPLFSRFDLLRYLGGS